MDQSQPINRQRSISNNSSIQTPTLRKRLNDFSKDLLVFSQFLKKDKHHHSQTNSVVGQKQQTQSITSKNPRNKQKPPSKKPPNLTIDTKPKSFSPCSDLYPLFKNNKLSAEYTSQMEKHQFKHLVVIGIILPTDMMKKLSKLIDFSQEYKISLPETVFSTDLIKLPQGANEREEVNYVFWTYEIGENGDIWHVKGSLSNLAYSGKHSPASNRSIKQHKQRKLSSTDQSNSNSKNLLLQIPQIVITTKNFIKDNTQLFFPQLLPDMPNSSFQPQKITLQPQLDIEKSLLYFDEEEINKSQKSIQTPRHMETSSKLMKEIKMKNPGMKSNSYIQLEPEEEYYNEEDRYRDNKLILPKGQLDRLNTARSNDQLTDEKGLTNRNENIQLFELLEKESIFRHVTYLSPYWLQQNDSMPFNDDQQHSKNSKNQRTRKGSLNTKNAQHSKLQKFKLLLTEWIKISLKKNYLYSRFCSNWLFLHFVSNFYRHNIPNSQKENDRRDNNSNNDGQDIGAYSNTYTSLLIKSLKTFRKQIQLRFFQRVENQYKGVMDQATLRNLLREIKLEELIFMKKNFSSLVLPNTKSSLTQYPPSKSPTFTYHQTSVDKEYLSELEQQITAFMDRLEDEIYFQNNRQAMYINEKVLETEYEKIIEEGIRKQRLKKKQSIQSTSSLNSQQPPISMNDPLSPRKKVSVYQSVTQQLQRDFTIFLDTYFEKGIKVSSQMKTFSDFMEKAKHSYVKNIYSLTREKKSFEKEEEEKENKNRMIKLLEMEIFKIQDKKKQVKEKNQLIKRQIKTVEERMKTSGEKDKLQNSIRKQRSKYDKTRGDKSIDQSGNFDPRHKTSLDLSNSNNRRNKKITTYAFEIQNPKNLSHVEDSIQKQKKQSFNRFSNRKSMQGNYKVDNYKRESIDERMEKKMKKNRCMTCCEVM